VQLSSLVLLLSSNNAILQVCQLTLVGSELNEVWEKHVDAPPEMKRRFSHVGYLSCAFGALNSNKQNDCTIDHLAAALNTLCCIY
jgi:hypothetical protein